MTARFFTTAMAPESYGRDYVIYYRETHSHVAIPHVVHGAPDPKKVFKT